MSETRSSSPEPRFRQWLRGIRPLLWWLVLVLILFGIRTHQRLSERTRLTFSVTLQGRPVQLETTALLDGRQIVRGDRVPLGKHTLTISHPKGVTVTTNLFIWYGERDLGEIDLQRGMGTLAIQTEPNATTLSIRGPDFSLILSNSTGMTSSVPTDHYVIEAKYQHWAESAETTVTSDAVAKMRFAPKLGALQLTCNQSGASFQLIQTDGRTLEAGDFPATVADVPEGICRLLAWHQGNQLERAIDLKARTTNTASIEFLYGAAVLETEPSGASVALADGRGVGTTPLRMSQVLVGERTFRLRKDGYETISVALSIVLDKTNSIRTNLTNINFAQAIDTARRSLAAGDYDRAFASASDALMSKAGDGEAMALKNEAAGRKNIRQGEALGNRGDYAAAIKSMESALAALPENATAKSLLADFQRREQEQMEKLRQERAGRPQKAFEDTLAKVKDSDLFESHELTTTKPAREVQAGIVNQLRGVVPNFQIVLADSPAAEIYRIEARQEFFGGSRSCVIIVGQLGNDETRILFKVLEYKTHHSLNVQGLLNLTASVEHIPVHPSRIPEMTDKLKAQVEEGQSLVRNRILRAIGQPQNEKR